ncbi:hypothetical protein ABZV52_29960 [Streptomyces sp. NPDC004735]|uniref:hypothetical protein n=1 Tax=Streptomyces sp. NPDC004735 TaxID=3156654 RepID=UPI0033AC1F1E
MPRIAKKLDLDLPDYENLRREAQEAVQNELSQRRRMDDRIELAAHIIRQADAEIALHADDRNAALASLFLYDHYEGRHLGLMAGVTKNNVREILSQAVYGDRKRTLPPRMSEEEMTELAHEHKVSHVKKSPGETLRSAGTVIETAKARRAVAVTAMQNAALVLHDTDVSLADIANKVGVSRKLIWQHVAAARKRRGY